MDFRRCAACGQRFRKRPQLLQQLYCPAPDCQRQRRRQWQQETRERDPDYKDNQARAQKAWSKRNPDYWRKYRRENPERSERNKMLQRERNAKRKKNPIAKMGASMTNLSVPSGVYRLVPIDVPMFAKMDAWTVEIKVLSTAYDLEVQHCKERT